MLKWMTLFVGVWSLSGCAHQGAVPVNCADHLRPVNSPIESHEPPASVVPKVSTDAKAVEPQP